MKLLENKIYITDTNNWFAPSYEFQKQYPSIMQIVIMDDTSSAGDWSGFFIQKTGERSAVAIPFWQENNYPLDGFTLCTGAAFIKGDCTEDFCDCARKEWDERVMRGYWS